MSTHSYPRHLAPVHIPGPAGPQPAAWNAPVLHRRSASAVAGIVSLVLLSALMLGVVVLMAFSFGPPALVLCAVLALIPLAVILLVVRWIDRWEPQPRASLWFALLWGAAAAVTAALLVGFFGERLVYLASSGELQINDTIGAIVQAPIVEEFSKGVGVLLILLARRRYFATPLDGVVYGAVVGAGFAFTENILYFGNALIQGGEAQLGGLFVVRGLFSPFAHVMFTACPGLVLGWSARRTGALGAIGYFLLGLIPAMGLHALWNGGLSFFDSFFGYYFLIQFPLFLISVAAVLLLRRGEVRLTRVRLGEYSRAGWFTAGEVEMLATWRGRRQARRWAARFPGPARGLMKRFTRDATRLAFTRQRILTGRHDIGAGFDEQELLARIVEDRRALTAVISAR